MRTAALARRAAVLGVDAAALRVALGGWCARGSSARPNAAATPSARPGRR
ncbi:hypothetical protein AB5I41_26555 [Sphingomonas sp. MMS24-JH45]